MKASHASKSKIQFMEYEAYHCLDLTAPQLDVLSWPYKWNVLHNGLFQITLILLFRFLKEDTRVKYSYWVPLPNSSSSEIHPERLLKKTNAQQLILALAKTQSGSNNSTFLKFKTFPTLAKIRRGKEGRKKTRRTKQLERKRRRRWRRRAGSGGSS